MLAKAKGVLRRWLIVMCGMCALTFIALLRTGVGSKGSLRTPERHDFDQAASRIVERVKEADLRGLASETSKDGVLFVSRYWDDERSGTEHPYKNGAPSALSFEGLTGVTWIERQVRIPQQEQSTKRFQKLLKEFSALVRETKEPFTPRWSLEIFDAWRCRTLGPAIEGKVVSNQYWYIYLRREDDKWKLWRLEEVIH